MTGRNSKPDHDGSASAPSRLDQYGDKQNQDDSRTLRDTGCEPQRKSKSET